MKTLLVIDNDSSHNWFKIFEKRRFDTPAGKQLIHVEQCGWRNISVVSASASQGCIVEISPSEGPCTTGRLWLKLVARCFSVFLSPFRR